MVNSCKLLGLHGVLAKNRQPFWFKTGGTLGKWGNKEMGGEASKQEKMGNPEPATL